MDVSKAKAKKLSVSIPWGSLHVSKGGGVTFSPHATDKVSSHFPRSPFTHPPFRASLLLFHSSSSFFLSFFFPFTTNEFRRSKPKRKTGRTNFLSPFFASLEKYLRPFLSPPLFCKENSIEPRLVPIWFNRSVDTRLMISGSSSCLRRNFVNRRSPASRRTRIYVLSKLNWTRRVEKKMYKWFLKIVCSRDFIRFFFGVVDEYER